MRPLEQLRTWFERDIHIATWRDVLVLDDTNHEAKLLFKTPRFTYVISAERHPDSGYLGCTVVQNAVKRGKDLPDGQFCENTWSEIVDAIRETEIVPIRDPNSRSR